MEGQLGMRLQRRRANQPESEFSMKYFRLTEEYLEYFQEDEAGHFVPKGRIMLSDIENIELLENGFLLHVQGRGVELQTPTPEEMDAWAEAFRVALEGDAGSEEEDEEPPKMTHSAPRPQRVSQRGSPSSSSARKSNAEGYDDPEVASPMSSPASSGRKQQSPNSAARNAAEAFGKIPSSARSTASGSTRSPNSTARSGESSDSPTPKAKAKTRPRGISEEEDDDEEGDSSMQSRSRLYQSTPNLNRTLSSEFSSAMAATRERLGLNTGPLICEYEQHQERLELAGIPSFGSDEWFKMRAKSGGWNKSTTSEGLDAGRRQVNGGTWNRHSHGKAYQKRSTPFKKVAIYDSTDGVTKKIMADPDRPLRRRDPPGPRNAAVATGDPITGGYGRGVRHFPTTSKYVICKVNECPWQHYGRYGTQRLSVASSYTR